MSWGLAWMVVGLGWGGYAWHGRAELDRAHLDFARRSQDAEGQHQERLQADQQAHAAELARLRQRVFELTRTETETFHARLTNADLLAGKLARDRHEAEWIRRLQHDPALAVTRLERMLVEVERVGRDPALAARDALAQVIRLVAPPESTNNLIPVQDKFIVELAFKMSALSPHEQGARTRHTSVEEMKRETVLMCAHVMREFFDSCGWRGINKMQIACNHATQQLAEPAESSTAKDSRNPPVDWRVLYRCSISEAVAARIASWRLLPLHKVAELMTVEEDGFQKLTLTPVSAGAAPPEDPTGPLKF